MTKSLLIEKNDKLLIVAPHPDDECIGCGGLLGLFSEFCSVICVSDGCKADNSVPESEMRFYRKKEFEREMQILGIKEYEMLGFVDCELIKNNNFVNKIEFSRFTKIFLPKQDDDHSDHLSVCAYILNHLKHYNYHLDVYLYEVHTPLRNINAYLDITSVIRKKLELIQIHRTQFIIHDYITQSKALAKFRACQCGYPEKYYEAYEKIDINETLVDDKDIIIEKQNHNIALLKRWILCEKGKYIESFFIKNKISTVAIYGYGTIGKFLVEYLANSEIEVRYVLDVKAGNFINEKIEVREPNIDNNSYVDAVIISLTLGENDEVKRRLFSYGYNKVFCINDLVGSVEK